MSTIIKKSTFKAAPEGIQRAVCVDVLDLGWLSTAWGVKEYVKIVWELECKMESGKPFIISRRYTSNLNEKSNLYKDLKSWRGRAFTAEELNGFDLEHIIGAPCTILVEHYEKEGSVYGNVKAITKATADPLKPTGEYKMNKDRPENERIKPAPKPTEASHEGSQEDASDSIPF